MKGADYFCSIFPYSEQIGSLYILPSSHARGKTFRIYVLPNGETVIENAGINPPLNKNIVEVYGVISGRPGWTEEYGWLYKGKFQEDFLNALNKRKQKIASDNLKRAAQTKKEAEKKETRIISLLSAYK